MNASAIFTRHTRTVFIAGLPALVLLMAGCKMEGGYARGLFSGYVIEKTEEEVSGKVGKPDAVATRIYKKKTFDPENSNLVDNKTILIFQKDVGGKLKVTELLFN